jgi:hypothetical protein
MRCAELPSPQLKETSRERIAECNLRLRLSDLTPSMPEDPRLKEPSKNDAGVEMKLIAPCLSNTSCPSYAAFATAEGTTPNCRIMPKAS